MKDFLNFDLRQACLSLYLHPLNLIRHWLGSIEIHDPKLAGLLSKLIPSRCPFERQIEFFGHTLLSIPPLCKLNPFYDQLIDLRFRSLSYLADECGLDVTSYY
jgi:hypothetical protein